MSYTGRIALVFLALLLLGGRTSYLSNTYEKHYFFRMYDDSTSDVSSFQACYPKASGAATLGALWCIAPPGRSETLRQWTLVVIEEIVGATENCTFTIETSTDLSTWTAVTTGDGGVIKAGTHADQANPAGVCNAGVDEELNTVGEYCTRTLADGLTIEPGGGWRIVISTTTDCEIIEGLGGHAISVIQ